jgi:enoyl-CoA hydratase/carnithine racemase
VGLKREMELALTNRLLSAQEAREWGLVTEVVPQESLASRAEELARSLAQGSYGRVWIGQASVARRMESDTGNADGVGKPRHCRSGRDSGPAGRNKGVCGEAESAVWTEVSEGVSP